MEQTVDLRELRSEVKRMKAEMVTRRELTNLLDTMAILSNEETMEQIRESERDIAAGRVKKIKSVADLFADS